VITTNLLNLKHGMPIQVKSQGAGSQPAAAKN
jgi:membrane fusion protein (multidrug efflux system)